MFLWFSHPSTNSEKLPYLAMWVLKNEKSEPL